MPGPAARALVADDDHVAGLICLAEDRRRRPPPGDSTTTAGPANVPEFLVDAGGLDDAAVRRRGCRAGRPGRRPRCRRARRRGCSRSPRRCRASSQRFGLRRTASAVRTPPGAAWNSSTASSDGVAAADVPRRQPVVQRRRRARCARPRCSSPPRSQLAEDAPGCRRRGARPPCGTSRVRRDLATGTARGGRRASMSASVKSTSASWAAASRCSTVLVEPPIAMSSAIAFSNAARVAIAARQHRLRRRRRSSAGPARRRCGRPPRNSSRAGGVGGQRRAVAGQREAERLGQAVHRVGGEHARAGAAGRAGRLLDARRASSSETASSADARPSRRSGRAACVHDAVDQRRPCRPPSGRRRRRPSGCSAAARPSACPGVILSQLEMQTSASAQCALTMYSTESAISSRRRQRVEHAAVAHRDAVVDGDRVELARRRRRPRAIAVGDDVARRSLQVHVAGHELGEASWRSRRSACRSRRRSCRWRARARGRRPCCGRGW